MGSATACSVSLRSFWVSAVGGIGRRLEHAIRRGRYNDPLREKIGISVLMIFALIGALPSFYLGYVFFIS